MANLPSLADLQLSLFQVSKAPPIITMAVQNTHQSLPITILTWNSPLDPAALGLGLISITPNGSTEAMHLDTIKISRTMPPNAESLVTLQAGERATNDVELRSTIVPQETWEKGKARVGLKGRWMAVWPGMTRDDVQQDPTKLRSLGAGDGHLIGDYESEYIEVEGSSGDT